jgi:hypothetical protein
MLTYLIEVGKESGLTEQALKFFRYFNEVKVEVDVDPETGEVLDCIIKDKWRS